MQLLHAMTLHIVCTASVAAWQAFIMQNNAASCAAPSLTCYVAVLIAHNCRRNEAPSGTLLFLSHFPQHARQFIDHQSHSICSCASGESQKDFDYPSYDSDYHKRSRSSKHSRQPGTHHKYYHHSSGRHHTIMPSFEQQDAAHLVPVEIGPKGWRRHTGRLCLVSFSPYAHAHLSESAHATASNCCGSCS